MSASRDRHPSIRYPYLTHPQRRKAFLSDAPRTSDHQSPNRQPPAHKAGMNSYLLGDLAGRTPARFRSPEPVPQPSAAPPSRFPGENYEDFRRRVLGMADEANEAKEVGDAALQVTGSSTPQDQLLPPLDRTASDEIDSQPPSYNGVGIEETDGPAQENQATQQMPTNCSPEAPLGGVPMERELYSHQLQSSWRNPPAYQGLHSNFDITTTFPITITYPGALRMYTPPPTEDEEDTPEYRMKRIRQELIRERNAREYDPGQWISGSMDRARSMVTAPYDYGDGMGMPGAVYGPDTISNHMDLSPHSTAGFTTPSESLPLSFQSTGGYNASTESLPLSFQSAGYNASTESLPLSFQSAGYNASTESPSSSFPSAGYNASTESPSSSFPSAGYNASTESPSSSFQSAGYNASTEALPSPPESSNYNSDSNAYANQETNTSADEHAPANSTKSRLRNKRLDKVLDPSISKPPRTISQREAPNVSIKTFSTMPHMKGTSETVTTLSPAQVPPQIPFMSDGITGHPLPPVMAIPSYLPKSDGPSEPTPALPSVKTIPTYASSKRKSSYDSGSAIQAYAFPRYSSSSDNFPMAPPPKPRSFKRSRRNPKSGREDFPAELVGKSSSGK